MLLFVGAGGCASSSSGFGVMLVQTFVLLGLVCVLAVVTIRLAIRYGYGGQKKQGRLEVLERVAIGTRHSVIALRAADRVLIVSQHGSGMETLTEMSRAEWDRVSFADVLAGDAAAKGAESVHGRAGGDLSGAQPTRDRASSLIDDDPTAALDRAEEARVHTTTGSRAGSDNELLL